MRPRNRVAQQIERQLARSLTSEATLLTAIASADVEHASDEQIAMFAEGNADLSTLLHMIRCPRCAELAETVLSLDNVEPLSAIAASPRRATTVARHIGGGIPCVCASLHMDSERRWLSPSQLANGGSRPSLAVRGGPSHGLTIRDRAESPNLELRIADSSPSQRLNLQLHWLQQAGNAPRTLRVEQGGRVVASTPIRDRTALVGSLRARDTTLWVESVEGPLALVTLLVENLR